MKRTFKVLVATALTGLVTLAMVAPSAQSANVPGCTPATNIEAIIDDSSSMLSTDPQDLTTGLNLRSQLVSIIAGNALNAGKTMGAVEFGSKATTTGPAAAILVGPVPIGTVSAQATFTSALANVKGNGPLGGDSGTDYDGGFALSNLANPAANARIFLSDGEPNPGTYNPAGPSVTPPTKTYVVGLGSGVSVSTGSPLQQIQSLTGGPPVFVANMASDLGPVSGDLTAALNCKTAPQRFTDNLTRPNQTKVHSFKATGKTADILTTWGSTSTTIATAPQLRAQGVTATVSKVKSKVKSRAQKGATFSAVHLTGLRKKQKIKFTVKASKLVTPTVAISQVIQ